MFRQQEEVESIESLLEQVRCKRVISWDIEKIVLEDGTTITLECTESDCCAGAYGEFKPLTERPPLDAMITDIVIGEEREVPDDYTIVNSVELKIFHNQNIICEAEMTADAGNGGYYYSVGSLKVNNITFPIVSA